jgi:hypothetical protein
MRIGTVVGRQLQHLPGSDLRLELLGTTFVLGPHAGAPRVTIPFLYTAQVGWYLVTMRLGCLGRVRFRCNTVEKTQYLYHLVELLATCVFHSYLVLVGTWVLRISKIPLRYEIMVIQ